MCMCAWSAPSAPQDLLLLVYKCVQSVKLLLLRVRQSFAKVARVKRCKPTALRVSPTFLSFGYRSREGFLLDKKREEKRRKKKKERKSIAHTIEMKPTCTVNFFNDSIQVARQTRIQIVIYLFVDVFSFFFV